MKVSTVIIITLLILALYYYTAETFPMVKTVGKYIATAVKDAAVVRSIDEYSEEIKSDLRSIPDKVTAILDNIKNYFTKER